MRSSNLIRVLGIAVVVGIVTACDAEPDGTAAASDQTDSTALAVAVAEALGAEVEGGLGEADRAGAFRMEPGPTAWDTLLSREIERFLGARSGSDTMSVRVLSTHGFERRGDTVAVTVVLRSCSPDDSTLNYAKDSLVHYFVASDEAGRGWRLAGPVVRDYSVGECTPASPG
jgi:hypothetical protein